MVAQRRQIGVVRPLSEERKGQPTASGKVKADSCPNEDSAVLLFCASSRVTFRELDSDNGKFW